MRVVEHVDSSTGAALDFEFEKQIIGCLGLKELLAQTEG